MPAFAAAPQSNYIPEVWGKKLLVNFYKSTCLHSITNNDYEGDIKGQGSKVQIRKSPDIAITDYDGSLTYTELGEDKIELLIDKAKAYAFKDDDIDSVQRDIKQFVNEATMNAATKTKIAIENDVFSTVYASAGTQIDAVTVPVTKDNVLDYIVDCGVALDEKNISEEGRFLVIPAWMAGMIKKSDLKDASLAGDGTSMLRNGRLGIVDRFTIYMSNNLTADGAGSDEFHCLAGTKEAISFATQFEKNRKMELENSFSWAYSGLSVYGYQVVQPDALLDLHAKKA